MLLGEQTGSQRLGNLPGVAQRGSAWGPLERRWHLTHWGACTHREPWMRRGLRAEPQTRQYGRGGEEPAKKIKNWEHLLVDELYKGEFYGI